MGEAKRRGTFEQRKATAKNPKVSDERGSKVTTYTPKLAVIMALADILAMSLEYRAPLPHNRISKKR